MSTPPIPSPDAFLSGDEKARMLLYLQLVYADQVPRSLSLPTGKNPATERGALIPVPPYTAVACLICKVPISVVAERPYPGELQQVNDAAMALHDKALAAGWLEPAGMRGFILLTKDGHAEMRVLETPKPPWYHSPLWSGAIGGLMTAAGIGLFGLVASQIPWATKVVPPSPSPPVISAQRSDERAAGGPIEAPGSSAPSGHQPTRTAKTGR